MVIARFSYPWVVVSLSIIFLILFCFAQIYFSRDTDIGFWLLVPFLPFLVLYAWELLRLAMFYRARALWIAEGKLVFLPYGWPKSFTTFLYSIPLEAIDHFSSASVETGSFVTWLQGILVHKKTGGYVQFPTYFMTEPRDVILMRLNEALVAHR
jgi:hypothetical protein